MDTDTKTETEKLIDAAFNNPTDSVLDKLLGEIGERVANGIASDVLTTTAKDFMAKCRDSGVVEKPDALRAFRRQLGKHLGLLDATMRLLGMPPATDEEVLALVRAGREQHANITNGATTVEEMRKALSPLAARSEQRRAKGEDALAILRRLLGVTT